MKKFIKIPWLIVFGLTATVLLVSAVSVFNAVSWINRPFPGFLVYEDPLRGSFGVNDWPGVQAGVPFLSRILAVEGQSVSKGQDVVNIARERAPGTDLQYLISSGDSSREVAVSTANFSIRDFFLVFLFTFIGGVVFYSIGLIVYLLKPNQRVSWVFLLACFGQAVYMITGFEIQSTYSLVYLHFFVLGLYPAFFLHLGLVFPEKKRLVIRWPKVEYLIYVPSLILASAFLYHFAAAGDRATDVQCQSYLVLGTGARVLMLFSFGGLIVLTLFDYFRPSTAQARQRARMILFGVTLASAPPVLIMALAYFLKVSFPWNFFVFFLIFFPAAVAYSIVRHNLFDADVIIRRAVGYTVITAIVIAAYSGVSVALNVFLENYELARSEAFPVLFTLCVILVFNPLRNRIQSLVDRIFFRKEYDYGEIIEKIGNAMTSLLELGQVAKRLVQTFMEDMFINTSSIMLLSPTGTGYQTFIAEGESRAEVEKVIFDRNEPLIGVIEKEKRELTRYDVLEDPRYSQVCRECTTGFDMLHSSLIVPLIYQDQVIGLLNIGDKKSGKPFKREDIDLLRALAHQGAIAIQNARLFQENLEKQRMEEELSIARDLQMSMLPAVCPEVKGFKIAAHSIPAREVGGDFFDFIAMGDRKVGFVIGDVTGKSVSGALVMSAARSVFRMLSEEHADVKDIMVRANRRTKKDIKSGMFVALLYAVLDSEEKRVTLCSAGQTQPILFSASLGEASLVETTGDTFPLGILEDADYEETQVPLSEGDKLVFYTDGIVEAMNEKEEIFGFENLIETVKDLGKLEADELLHEILDRVKEFVGGAEQHDDLTLIVVSVEQ